MKGILLVAAGFVAGCVLAYRAPKIAKSVNNAFNSIVEVSGTTVSTVGDAAVSLTN